MSLMFMKKNDDGFFISWTLNHIGIFGEAQIVKPKQTMSVFLSNAGLV
jgi:hypothetical protein